MAETILAIDVGSSTLKVVQVSRSLRAVQLSGYASVNLPADPDPSEVARTLKDLLSEHGLESDHYVLAVGTQEAFLRRVSFPFTAERKIGEVIKFEIEPSLPLGINETEVDFIKTERHEDGSQGVLAAAMPRRVLEPLLEALREIEIEPGAIDLDGIGLNVLANELGDQLPERAILLDIGHSKTNLLYRQQNRNFHLRALAFGCSRLAGTVSSVLGLSADEGMQRLLSVRLHEPSATPDDERTREAIGREIKWLSREIELSLLSLESRERPVGPALVVLSGGGSLVGGLAPALETALGIPVRCLGDFKDIGLFNTFRETPSDLARFAVPAGLALTDKRRQEGFNFQEQELRTRGLLMKWRQHLLYALVAGLVVGLSWFASVGMDIYAKKQQLKQLDQAMDTVFRRALPEFKGSARPTQYPSILKARIEELNTSVALFGADARHHMAVELLRGINEAVPPSLDVTVNLLTLDRQRVRISGRADAFNTVDTVKNQLEASDAFVNVAIAGAKAAADGKGVQFSLDLNRSSVSGEGS